MSIESREMNSSVMQTNENRPWLIEVALRRHCAWALPAGILMSIFAACVFLVIVPPEYEATHILQANNDYILSKDLMDVSENWVKNELPIIMSPPVLDGVLNDPQLRAVPSLSNPNLRERELRKRLKVSNGGADNLILISYQDYDKKQVAKVANAIAESYVSEKRRFDDQRLKSLELSLVQPLERSRRNVEKARRQYEELAKRLLGRNPFAISRDSKVEESEQNSVGSPGPGVETAELLFVQKELESETEYFSKLNDRVLAFRAELARGPRLVVRAMAVEPTAPVEDWPVGAMALGGLLAFCLPFALAMLLELRRRSLEAE